MQHAVVSHEEWLTARKKHLVAEKEFTRARDRLSESRRELPWERVEKDYVFDGAEGKLSLSELFDGRSQLVIYHAMFDPEHATAKTSWTTDAACPACSFWIDNFNGIAVHLNHRDVTIAAVSRAPYPKIAAYKERMGWSIPWMSSHGSDFNADYGVSFTPEEVATPVYNYGTAEPFQTEGPGISVFFRDAGGAIYHTYSAYARGLDMLNVAYHYMDLVPKGRDESKGAMSWLRRHDEYAEAAGRR